jgi:AsmA-like C-terminal region
MASSLLPDLMEAVAAPAPTHHDPPQPRGRVVQMRRRPSRRWRWIAAALIVLMALIAIGVRIVIRHAQPILRARVIETLATRFKSRVELEGIQVSVTNGLEVSGEGLRIFGATDPNPSEDGVQPLLEIQEFRFHTGLRNLFREPMHVETVFVKGLTMNIPPKENRQQMGNMRRGGKMSVAVGRFVCNDTRLIINTLKPGKLPLQFDISDLKMRDIGPGKPLFFEATLVNPKPTGDIQSTGQFGPLNEESPRNTAVEGTYTFTHADLGTLKGIAGILSSSGKYGGTLGRIEVEGKTDTPDFRVNVSQHPVHLHTDFHAIVDGTDGDTYLQPVKARFLNSWLTARGKVIRVKPRGHDIELNVVLGQARIEDLLRLGVRTDPPIMSGAVAMTTKLRLPPSDADLSRRLQLEGDFHVPAGHFTNEKLQDRIDSFSLRSQGKPKLARQLSHDDVLSDLSGTFILKDGVLSFSLLRFMVPGTHADMTGQYSLDGNTFDFHGKMKLDAKLSQMLTGWKSILLKPVDPFFHKHGAGTELPFKVTGTRSEPHFGLDFHHKEESKRENAAPPGAAR